MIISQTPFRISFFGGGTDYPSWYQENGGAVISTTIDKYSYITCRQLPPFFEHKHRIVYSLVECVNETKEIRHPAVKAVFDFLEIKEGLEIHYDGDLPARSGLGSSSSFTVGMLNALFALKGERKAKREMAELAIHIEQNVINETVGSQDQIAASFGGFNRINFARTGGFDVQPIIMPPAKQSRLNDCLMLFFTGFSRTAATVAKVQVDNMRNLSTEMRAIGSLVDQAQSVLQSPSVELDDIGRLLHEGWMQKRSISDRVSSAKIDEIYEAGLSNGALGGKLLGAGGGGFMLFYVTPENQDRVRAALKHLIEVDFRFETSGSQIIFYNPTQAIYRSTRPAHLASRDLMNRQ